MRLFGDVVGNIRRQDELKKVDQGRRGGPQSLLAEDQGLVPSTHMLAHSSVTPVLGDLMSSSGTSKHRVHVIYMLAGTYIFLKSRKVELMKAFSSSLVQSSNG